MGKIKRKTLMSSLFFESLVFIRKRPKNILFILFIDFLFLLALSLIGKMVVKYLPKDPANINSWLASAGISPLFLLVAYLFYNLILLLLYSILKLLVLKKIGEMDDNPLKYRLKDFFLLNLTLFSGTLISFMLISWILSFLFKESLFKVLIVALLVIYILLFYLFVNFSHSLFVRQKSIKGILKGSYHILFNGCTKYYGALIFPAAFFAAALGLFFILGNVARAFHMSEGTYEVITITISFVLVYFVLFINRVYIYLISKKC